MLDIMQTRLDRGNFRRSAKGSCHQSADRFEIGGISKCFATSGLQNAFADAPHDDNKFSFHEQDKEYTSSIGQESDIIANFLLVSSLAGYSAKQQEYFLDIGRHFSAEYNAFRIGKATESLLKNDQSTSIDQTSLSPTSHSESDRSDKLFQHDVASNEEANCAINGGEHGVSTIDAEYCDEIDNISNTAKKDRCVFNGTYDEAKMETKNLNSVPSYKGSLTKHRLSRGLRAPHFSTDAVLTFKVQSEDKDSDPAALQRSPRASRNVDCHFSPSTEEGRQSQRGRSSSPSLMVNQSTIRIQSSMRFPTSGGGLCRHVASPCSCVEAINKKDGRRIAARIILASKQQRLRRRFSAWRSLTCNCPTRSWLNLCRLYSVMVGSLASRYSQTASPAAPPLGKMCGTDFVKSSWRTSECQWRKVETPRGQVAPTATALPRDIRAVLYRTWQGWQSRALNRKKSLNISNRAWKKFRQAVLFRSLRDWQRITLKWSGWAVFCRACTAAVRKREGSKAALLVKEFRFRQRRCAALLVMLGMRRRIKARKALLHWKAFRCSARRIKHCADMTRSSQQRRIVSLICVAWAARAIRRRKILTATCLTTSRLRHKSVSTVLSGWKEVSRNLLFFRWHKYCSIVIAVMKKQRKTALRRATEERLKGVNKAKTLSSLARSRNRSSLMKTWLRWKLHSAYTQRIQHLSRCSQIRRYHTHLARSWKTWYSRILRRQTLQKRYLFCQAKRVRMECKSSFWRWSISAFGQYGASMWRQLCQALLWSWTKYRWKRRARFSENRKVGRTNNKAFRLIKRHLKWRALIHAWHTFCVFVQSKDKVREKILSFQFHQRAKILFCILKDWRSKVLQRDSAFPQLLPAPAYTCESELNRTQQSRDEFIRPDWMANTQVDEFDELALAKHEQMELEEHFRTVQQQLLSRRQYSIFAQAKDETVCLNSSGWSVNRAQEREWLKSLDDLEHVIVSLEAVLSLIMLHEHGRNAEILTNKPYSDLLPEEPLKRFKACKDQLKHLLGEAQLQRSSGVDAVCIKQFTDMLTYWYKGLSRGTVECEAFISQQKHVILKSQAELSSLESELLIMRQELAEKDQEMSKILEQLREAMLDNLVQRSAKDLSLSFASTAAQSEYAPEAALVAPAAEHKHEAGEMSLLTEINTYKSRMVTTPDAHRKLEDLHQPAPAANRLSPPPSEPLSSVRVPATAGAARAHVRTEARRALLNNIPNQDNEREKQADSDGYPSIPSNGLMVNVGEPLAVAYTATRARMGHTHAASGRGQMSKGANAVVADTAAGNVRGSASRGVAAASQASESFPSSRIVQDGEFLGLMSRLRAKGEQAHDSAFYF